MLLRCLKSNSGASKALTTNQTLHNDRKNPMGFLKSMPDVAATGTITTSNKLDRVGMSEIEVPIVLESSEFGKITSLGLATAYVSLDDPDAKGIHMSRLYLSLVSHLEAGPLHLGRLSQVLDDFLDTHKNLSESAFVSIAYDQIVKRPALVSSNQGWRSYPVKLIGERQGSKESLQLTFEVTYSSTCPCSAALSRQVMQQQFASDFEHEKIITKDEVLAWLGINGTIATPHSQRSIAKISVTPNNPENFSVTNMIEMVEDTLGTPVQAAVKREDEMEFARRNGANLMFVEDAARKVQRTLDSCDNLRAFSIKVSHLESLHAHDAVAYASDDHQPTMNR